MINSWIFKNFLMLKDACLFMKVICFILPSNMLVFSPDETRTSELEQREECHNY